MSLEDLIVKSGKQALGLSLKLWFNYIKTNDRKEIHRAMHVVVSALNKRLTDMGLYFLKIFLSLALDDLDVARDQLENLSPHKNYFKSSESNKYAVYIYLNTIYFIKTQDSKQSKKHLKILEELYAESKDFRYPLLIASVLQELKDEKGAGVYLATSYFYGNNSAFFYLSLYRHFSAIDEIVETKKLLLRFIKWAIAHNFDLTQIFLKHNASISKEIDSDLPLCKAIYKAYPGEWIVHLLCNQFIANSDLSPEAFSFYKLAAEHQMFIKGLNFFLVKAFIRYYCSEMVMPDEAGISRYALEEYLQNNRVETNEKAFLYHYLLGNKRFEDLVHLIQLDLRNYTVSCIENKKKGIFYNSLYQYFLLTELYKDGTLINDSYERDYGKTIDEFLLASLFQTDVYVTAEKNAKSIAGSILISEKEKSEATEYKLNEGWTRIETAGEGFSYFILDEEGKESLDLKVNIVRQIYNEDYRVYLHFFKKGLRSPNLLIAISKHLMNTPHTEEKIGIIKETLALNKLSKAFKMQLNAALGNALYAENRYNLALEHYKIVDENLLNDKFIEKMIMVFLNTKEYDKAVRILMKKSHCISDRTLFFALKKLSTFEKYHPLIANSAYELILKSWYDSQLLDLVIKNYKGSSEEWTVLSNALSMISVYEKGLDEIILRNSLWVRKLDEGTQKVFIRMFETAPDCKLVLSYITFFEMEMIVNKFKPEYEALDLLEKLYLRKKEKADSQGEVKLLCYALAHAYSYHSIRSAHSEAITRDALKGMEEDGFIFKPFKEASVPATPFLAKNQSFIYKAAPDKDVYLIYSFDGEGYLTKKMTYFRFGLYLSILPHYYGERITYYFTEESKTGTVSTETMIIENNISTLYENEDNFFKVNNALIYEKMFYYDQAEKIISDLLEPSPNILASIL